MIPKAEATKAAQDFYDGHAKALETKIDNMIKSSWAGPIHVDISGIPRPAVDAVAAKYKSKEGGWIVTITDNQHDGPTLVLT